MLTKEQIRQISLFVSFLEELETNEQRVEALAKIEICSSCGEVGRTYGQCPCNPGFDE